MTLAKMIAEDQVLPDIAALFLVVWTINGFLVLFCCMDYLLTAHKRKK